MPTDLRNGYNGLYGIVTREFHLDPLRGDAFLFLNARRKSAKVLLWDGTGLCIYSKILAEGAFSNLFAGTDDAPLSMTTAELTLFLEGADLAKNLPISPRNFTFER